MSELVKKCASFLANHKKKAFSVAFVASMYGAMKHIKRTKKFEDTISKLEQKVQSQIESEFKAKAELLRKNANYEDIYSYFLGLDKAIKRSLKSQVDSLFKIDEIKASLKEKGLSQDQKLKIWNDLKTEIFTQAIFSLVYIPITRTIFFIRECIINGQENSIKEKNKDEYQSFEGFLTELSEHIIIDGGRLLYGYIKEEITPIVNGLNVLTKYKEGQILDVIEEIKQIILSVETEEGKMTRTKEQFQGEGNERIVKMLVEGKKGKAKRNKNNEVKRDALPFPKFQFKILDKFISTIHNTRVSEDKEVFETYCKELQEADDRIHKLLYPERTEKEVLAIEGDNMKEGEEGDDGLLVRTGMTMEEAKASNEQKEQQKTAHEIVQESGNDFMDFLESQNLALLSLYTLGYEFEKLKNRVTLYYRAKGGENEEIALANFLSGLQKIVQEEFISEEADEVRENFYNMKIKASLGSLRNQDASVEEMEISHRILVEAEMKKEVDLAFKEFGKKIYLGKDYEKAAEKKGNGEDKGLDLLLNGLSGMSLGKNADFE